MVELIVSTVVISLITLLIILIAQYIISKDYKKCKAELNEQTREYHDR